MKHLSIVTFLMFFTSGFFAQHPSFCKTNKSSKGITVTKSTNANEAQILKSVQTFNHSRWNKLLKEYVSDEGLVNYKQLKQNPDVLADYIIQLQENTPTDSWTKENKLAYWINAYNALTIDLILKNYPLNSIRDINKPWNQRLWKLGDKWYNLDEIEHRILRKMNEPRIHFAIVCASYSCPKLLDEAYTADKLELQLNTVTFDFISDPERNTITQDKIKLSKIFNWFVKDFTRDGTLIDYLNQFSHTKISSRAKKSFKDYNWDLNE